MRLWRATSLNILNHARSIVDLPTRLVYQAFLHGAKSRHSQETTGSIAFLMWTSMWTWKTIGKSSIIEDVAQKQVSPNILIMLMSVLGGAEAAGVTGAAEAAGAAGAAEPSKQG